MKGTSKNEILEFFFCFSVNKTDSDVILEMSSTPAETIVEDQAVTKDEDNETEISQYLTLTQLGNILRKLAVPGNTHFYSCKQLKSLLWLMKNLQLQYQNYLYMLDHGCYINSHFRN